MAVRRAKITIIGAGMTGATTAHWCAASELGEIVLYDVIEGLPQGKALDLSEATPIARTDQRITGTCDWEDTARSDVVIITAGSPRKPGMSRKDLLATNHRVVEEVARQAVLRSPDAIFVVLTNPVDVMAYVVLRVTGLPPERVVGQAGILDATRFRAFVAMELGVSVRDVHAIVLGGHGDGMLPMVRLAQVGGVPLTELLERSKIDALVERTRRGGGEIVELLKASSAFYAPGAALAEMVAAIVRDQHRVLPAPAYLRGEYGISGLYTGVPIVLGAGGVERILEILLTAEEQTLFLRSADEVRGEMAELPTTV